VTPRGAARLLDLSWLAYDLVGRRVGPRDPGAMEPGRPPVFLTAVFRAPAEHARDLAALLDELRVLGQGQHVYPEASLHVTLAPVADPRAGPEVVSPALAAAARRLAAPPLTISVVGLAMTPGSLVALGLPNDDRLARERAALRPVLGRPDRRWHGPLRSDGLVHLTLARWRHRPSSALVAAIRTRRRLSLPPRPVDAIELVRTNKVMDAGNTVVLERFPLVD
jgi:2'-5' RNA ligase